MSRTDATRRENHRHLHQASPVKTNQQPLFSRSESCPHGKETRGRLYHTRRSCKSAMNRHRKDCGVAE
jgi:hypothetical protein